MNKLLGILIIVLIIGLYYLISQIKYLTTGPEHYVKGDDVRDAVTDLVRSNPLVGGVETLSNTKIKGKVCDCDCVKEDDARDAVGNVSDNMIDPIKNMFSF